MINHCKRCLYPTNHALNIILDDNGICSGCRVHEEKDVIDFETRGEKLAELLDIYRNRSENNYDCIIPVNGAKDSFFIVHLIRNVYGMNPLLVCYNSQFNTPVGQRNLARLRMKFGVDLIQQTVSTDKVKKVVKATLRRFGSIYWHVIAGETVFPVQMAVQMKIPLIIWGVHQGMDQVGMYSHQDYVEMNRKYRKDHDLMGVEAEDLVNEFDQITYNDIAPYVYPSNRELERIGVRGIYLNNYIRWDSRTQHEMVIKKYGFETRDQTRTFDNCSNNDCYMYSDVHDYIKLIKHGYSKVNDHVAREIRLGHMDQIQGIELIRRYINKKPEYLDMFCEWLSISKSGFWFVIDQFRNSKFWSRNDEWEWVLNHNLPIGLMNGDSYNYPDTKPFRGYAATQKGKSTDRTDGFILIGKGYATND